MVVARPIRITGAVTTLSGQVELTGALGANGAQKRNSQVVSGRLRFAVAPFIDDQRRGVKIGQVELEFGFPVTGVQRSASRNRGYAEESGGHVRTIRKSQGDAVFGRDTPRT